MTTYIYDLTILDNKFINKSRDNDIMLSIWHLFILSTILYVLFVVMEVT